MKLKTYINNLKVKDIFPRNDGGFVLLLEKVEIITRQSNNDFRMRYPSYVESTDNIYGEIILISIHETGEEFWSKIITKIRFHQTTRVFILLWSAKNVWQDEHYFQ